MYGFVVNDISICWYKYMRLCSILFYLYFKIETVYIKTINCAILHLLKIKLFDILLSEIYLSSRRMILAKVIITWFSKRKKYEYATKFLTAVYLYAIYHEMWELIKERLMWDYFPTHQSFNNPENSDNQEGLRIRVQTNSIYIQGGGLVSLPTVLPKCPAFSFSNNNNNKKRRRAVLIRGFARLTWLTRRAEEDWGKGRGKGRMPLSFRVFIISANWGVVFRHLDRRGLNLRFHDLYFRSLFPPVSFRFFYFTSFFMLFNHSSGNDSLLSLSRTYSVRG